MRTPEDIYDELLVLRCQAGESDALVQLVQRWHPRLLKFAMRLTGERADAEDAVQSAWVVIVRRVNRLRDPAAVRPWMFRVVANKCVDRIRARTSERRRETALEFDPVSPEYRESTASSEHNANRLRSALKRLDEDKRTVLRRHYLLGMSLKQIGAALGLPVGTVKSRLHHARNQLRSTIEGEQHDRP